jgi:hypothetical protein
MTVQLVDFKIINSAGNINGSQGFTSDPNFHFALFIRNDVKKTTENISDFVET